MSDELIYIPFPRAIYDDMVRYSEIGIDVPAIVRTEIETWLYHSIADDHWDWGDNWMEIAERYAPDEARKYRDRLAPEKLGRLNVSRPMIWKEISVPEGSLVRMAYQGRHHFGAVKDGQITDDDGAFSPSRWASKVADHTNRNAWRDIWFQTPGGKSWRSAESMRAAARSAKL